MNPGEQLRNEWYKDVVGFPPSIPWEKLNSVTKNAWEETAREEV